MSTSLHKLLGLPEDPRQIELIRSILEKTREGKIAWTKQGNAITATIPSGFQTNFVLSPATLFGTPSTWELFTVRDKNATELVRVRNVAMYANIFAGETPDPVIDTTNELFKAVYGAAGDDLDRAINAIKKL